VTRCRHLRRDPRDPPPLPHRDAPCWQLSRSLRCCLGSPWRGSRSSRNRLRNL